ncbi:replicative DNA helicase [Neorickettsia risticii str. Illinois]|uniref:Replicative DNA helicase n=1 Tax=Neorickettsia risticii (strain Illinois) TaxID=434131 RepID=C6V542_NEORI|nr:replicative DNA helicase [Neorickettsia risticii str. Illinois]
MLGLGPRGRGFESLHSDTFLHYQKALSNSSAELPNNIEAEQLILGALLTNNDACDEIEELISSSSFYAPVHRKIFEVLLHLRSKELVANPVTLKNYLESSNELSAIGGQEYLLNIIEKASIVVDVSSLARVIQELYIRRQLIVLAQKIISGATGEQSNTTTSEQIEEAEHSLFQLASSGELDPSCLHISKPIEIAVERAKITFKAKVPFQNTSTGFRDIDNLLGGLQNSDLLIIAGRPSMGKTSLAISMALRVTRELQKQGMSACFFSLEMSADQIASRMLSVHSGVDAFSIRTGKKFSEESLKKVIESSKELSELPLFIDDTASVSISALRTKLRRLHRKTKLGAIFIDYLQLLRGSKGTEFNRVQEVSEITKGLKLIAKELNVPVVALSQLSRLVEQREDKRPQLSDLRESGSIEQDADVVMFVFREAYYMMRKQPSSDDENYENWQFKMDEVRNKAEIIIAKQRNGPVGTALLFFDQSTTVFDDLSLFSDD